MSGTYYPGSSVQLTATFTNPANGSAVDPTTVTAEVVGPDLYITTLTVTKSSVGNYAAIFSPYMPGKHTQRWTGTGANAQAMEATFLVNRSADPNAG